MYQKLSFIDAGIKQAAMLLLHVSKSGRDLNKGVSQSVKKTSSKNDIYIHKTHSAEHK